MKRAVAEIGRRLHALQARSGRLGAQRGKRLRAFLYGSAQGTGGGSGQKSGGSQNGTALHGFTITTNKNLFTVLYRVDKFESSRQTEFARIEQKSGIEMPTIVLLAVPDGSGGQLDRPCRAEC